MVPYTGIVNMRRYHLQSAFLSHGWTRDVIVTVSDQGFITHIDAAAPTSPAGSSASAQVRSGVPKMRERGKRTASPVITIASIQIE